MSAFDEIREWVVETIEAVAGSEHVYGTLRLIQNESELEADFGLGEPPEGELQQRTHGWMVSIRARPEAEEFDSYEALQPYTLQATCFSSVYDRGASEVDFTNHVLEVAQALHADLSPDAIEGIYDVSPVAIEFELVEFPRIGGRLHHRAILSWTVRTTERVRSE